MAIFFRRNFSVLLLGIFLLYFCIRVIGIGIPYYQDEWKNISASVNIEAAGNFFTHPPLMQMLFVGAYNMLGEYFFRLFPLMFSLVSAILLYLVAKNRYGKKTAVISLILYSLCFYNILGSLVPDVDGAILPFLFLLAVYIYDCINNTPTTRRRYLLFILLVTTCLAGLLIKLSFIIAIGALLFDCVWNNRRTISFKRILHTTSIIFGSTIFYILILYTIEFLYPAFSIESMLGHAKSYSPEMGRSYTQIIIQTVKSIYYLSPLLLIPLLFVTRDVIKRSSLFFFYIFLGLIFYLILFDFSRGALDKYLVFTVAPLSMVCGLIISKIFEDNNEKYITWKLIGIGLVISVFLVFLNFLPHEVISLYPKTEWFARVLYGDWRVLTPLTGGSGPIGFYVSFLFIALSFILSFGIVVVTFFQKKWRAGAIIILFMIGVVYNIVFTEEYLYGKINGSTPEVLESVAVFIQSSNSINQIFTYNDIGAQDLSKMGKYAGRFYATPDFEEGHRNKFANFRGQYMVIDMPHLYENGFYGEFFRKCKVLFETSSVSIIGRVYNCPESKISEK